MSATDERTLSARLAAHASWAQTGDRRARTAPATAAAAARKHALRQLEREIDPDGTLHPIERRKRAENARQAALARAQLNQVKAERLRDQAAALDHQAAAEAERAGCA